MANIPEIELVRDEITGELIPEIWKPIPNYEGLYEASNYGRIKSFKRNRELILKPTINDNGYFTIHLWDDDRVKKTRSVHQLIAEVFLNHTPCGYTLVVDHKDFNRANNKEWNLKIVTARKNTSLRNYKSSSKFTGVSWHKRSSKWQSRIRIKSKSLYLGCFTTEVEASNAYQRALEKLNN